MIFFGLRQGFYPFRRLRFDFGFDMPENIKPTENSAPNNIANRFFITLPLALGGA